MVVWGYNQRVVISYFPKRPNDQFPKPPNYFFSKSRISVSSFSSALGSGAGAGAASSSFLRVRAAMPFTMKKIHRAMMRKSTTFWMNWPYLSTAAPSPSPIWKARFAKSMLPVKSTLGAGDTFKAGCVYALLKGMTDDETVRFASACSAVAISRFPLPLNPPTLEEVNQLI